MAYKITCDSTCDMPRDFYESREIPVLGMRYLLDETEYREGDPDAPTPKAFYDKLRAGSRSVTSQITVLEFQEFAEPLVKDGFDILHITLSSALSGTYSSCLQAAAKLEAKYPGRRVLVFDSKAASGGEGMLLYHATENKARGMSLEDNFRWLEDHRGHICCRFTVEDLLHLHRGGRLSKSSAVVGSLLGIQPILRLDEEGKLELTSKTRGRTGALRVLAEAVKTHSFDNVRDQTIFVCHSDSLADAEKLTEMIRDLTGAQNFLIAEIGTVIGSHTGAGTAAVCFMGPKR